MSGALRPPLWPVWTGRSRRPRPTAGSRTHAMCPHPEPTTLEACRSPAHGNRGGSVMSDHTHEVAVVVQSGVLPFDVAAVEQVFAPAGQAGGPYRVRVCSDESGPLAGGGSYGVQVAHDLSVLPEAGTVMVAGVADPTRGVSPKIASALRSASDRGARIVGIGTGVFALGRAGLLAGRHVTTHWRYSDLLRRTFPSVKVDAAALFVQDG